MKPERFRCCQHCVDPCPANGHTRRCPDCKPGAVGRTVEPRRFPPGSVRGWSITGRRSPEPDRKPIVMEPFELIRSVPR